MPLGLGLGLALTQGVPPRDDVGWRRCLQDSYSSLRLVKTLRKLANQKRTVICTIHQPRAEIFGYRLAVAVPKQLARHALTFRPFWPPPSPLRLFDTLLLMKNGETAYFGAISDIARYFEGGRLPIPHGINVADFVGAYKAKEEETRGWGVGAVGCWVGLGVGDEGHKVAP